MSSCVISAYVSYTIKKLLACLLAMLISTAKRPALFVSAAIIYSFDRMMVYTVPVTHYIISSYERIKALANA